MQQVLFAHKSKGVCKAGLAYVLLSINQNFVFREENLINRLAVNS